MPGTSGLLTPFGKMDGLYFDGSDEPDDFKFDFKEAINEIVKRKDVDHITLEFETREDYYKMMNMLRTWNDTNISAYSSSLEDDNTIVILEEEDLDERESTS